MMGRYFGTDGFRGEANVGVTAEQAFLLGRFLGWYTREKKAQNGFPSPRSRVVIGKDARRSGYMLEYALAAGLTASGADAYLLHVTTTPSVSFVTRAEGFDCGIMISASHNPYYDNGIKLIGPGGEKADDTLTGLAEDALDGAFSAFGREWRKIPLATRSEIGRTVDYVAGRNRYIGYLISLCGYSLRGMRIGLDLANGSAWSIARAVYEALGATVYTIHAEPNGLNINDGAGSTHPGELARLVREKGLDAGFAFDGDADRCIAANEKGEIVNGDGILYVAGSYLAERKELANKTVVGTVMANGGLERALSEEGIRLLRTPVGDRFVFEAMCEHGCSLGGEPSGHIIFGKHACTGDGILTSLKLLEVMCEKETVLSALTSPLRLFPEYSVNVRVRDPEATARDGAVLDFVRQTQDALSCRGRILLRASGTEPVVRIHAEAEDAATAKEAAEAVADAVISAGYGV